MVSFWSTSLVQRVWKSKIFTISPLFRKFIKVMKSLPNDPGGLKTIWFQSSANLEDAKVQVWSLNDNYQPFWFCDLFFQTILKNADLAPNQTWNVRELKTDLAIFNRELDCGTKVDLAPNHHFPFSARMRSWTTVNRRETWPLINAIFCHKFVCQSKTDLAFAICNKFEFYISVFHVFKPKSLATEESQAMET